MQDQSDANKQCYDKDCEHNSPYMRPHAHVRTINGVYVRFIVDKPKPIRSISDADTR